MEYGLVYIILAALVALTVFYLWGSYLETEKMTEQSNNETPATENTDLGSGDDLNSIEADLNGTEVDSTANADYGFE